jgi:pimeloyl-ACP methyl ester carboxylesterase/AraC-like DNA-binding protein
MDVLSDILGSLRLTGGVVIDADLHGDFCVRAQFTPAHCAPFFPTPDTLISYHYVRSGRMVVEVDGMPPAVVEAGGIAILPRNDPHLLASRTGLQPANADDVSWITADGVHHVAQGTDGPKTEVWCGFLGTAKSSAHPLLDALPPLLVLDVADGEAEWLDSSLRFVAEEQPPPDVVAKLAELFLNQAIRDYVEALPVDAQGWLRGLTDPAVTKALSIIHTRFAEDLEVEQLAREAGVSRTVLGERFVELIGEPPMRYCGRWRMRMAANMLRDGRDNTANIAFAVGFNSEAAFNRAFKREYGEPPATWRRRIEAEDRAQEEELAVARRDLPEQVVRYCTAHDGTRLAFSIVGTGPPLVKTANWLNHIEYDWTSPLWRHWIKELTDHRTLIRYDERANGLSDWDTPEISLEAFVDDLACVVDAARLDRFDLLAISQGAAVAIAYAVRHPERVRKLIICNGYAQGWAERANPEELARREAMITLSEIGWGSDNPAYRQIFTGTYIPGGSHEQMDWFNEMQRRSASPKNAVILQRVLGKLDVVDLLPKVQTPTLIFHSRRDQAVPFAQGELMAAQIPNATFVPLDSDNHIFLSSEPAWSQFTEVTREFLKEDWTDTSYVAPARSRVSDEVGTCRSRDGTSIAYAACGEGFPLLKAPNWMTNVDLDWSSPVYRHWLAEGARANRLIRFDMRGFGRSEREPVAFTFETMVEDMAAVVDDAGVEQCDLLGISHGAAIAMAYAARNPDRVRKLVLVNSFAAGWKVRADPEELAWRQSLIEMNRREWAFRRSALGEMFITLYFPSAGPDLIAWNNEHLQELGSVSNLEPMIELAATIDVRGELENIRAPTLVMHARQDGNAVLEVGRQVAEGIAGARFVELDSANHVTLGDEPAWPVLVKELRAFLRD